VSKEDGMSSVGWVHTVFGILALISGAVTLVLPKGGGRHRGFGYSYAACMVLLNGTSFLIYKMLGHFGPFHALALVSLVTLATGLLPALRRQPRGEWVARHYRGMSHSYIGLCAATLAEVGIRLPLVREHGLSIPATVVATIVAVFVGNFLLSRFDARQSARTAEGVNAPAVV
jgi:uncharacterized membrane protein